MEIGTEAEQFSEKVYINGSVRPRRGGLKRDCDGLGGCRTWLWGWSRLQDHLQDWLDMMSPLYCPSCPCVPGCDHVWRSRVSSGVGVGGRRLEHLYVNVLLGMSSAIRILPAMSKKDRI